MLRPVDPNELISPSLKDRFHSWPRRDVRMMMRQPSASILQVFRKD